MSGSDGPYNAVAPIPGHLESRVAALEDVQGRRDFLDAVVRHQDRLVDRGHAYTNLIMAAGYAGYFALWGLAKDFITPSLARCSLAAMGLSLIVFVAFEISKMFVVAVAARKWSTVAKTLSEDLRDRTRQIEQFTAEVARREQNTYRFWQATLAVSLVLGLIGASVLVYALLHGNLRA